MGVLKTKPRTPPWPPYPKWSTSKWWTFMRSKMRSAFTRWPPKYEVLEEARRKYTGSNPRQKYEFQCSQCKKYFKQTEVEVDHITPCGSLKSFEDLPGFTERMFCGKEGLRVVCTVCHKAITKEARAKKDV